MRKAIKIIVIITLFGLLLPAQGVVPVQNATPKDWHKSSFWFSPWGQSGVHKGIDIFAPKGTHVIASTTGLVLFSGNIAMGGNVVAVLGPKWRIHYYAHLQSINAKKFDWAAKGNIIGTVGTSGNAKGKPPHLHYSIVTLLPYPWRITAGWQGWKRMFYLNPIEQF